MKRILIRASPGGGWRLTFKYHGGGNDVDIEIEGSAKAVQVGLGITGALVGVRVKKMFEAGDVPQALFTEGMMLSAIAAGGAVEAYEGQFLRIEPAAGVSGLSTSVSLAWKD